MRKKLSEDKKKPSFGVSFDPILLDLIKEYTEKNNIKISRFIENVIREHFDNEKEKNNRNNK